MEKKFDIVGAAILGFITAIGGGTLRDIMIGETPVAWMKDSNYVIAILSGVVLCYIARKYIMKLRKGLFLLIPSALDCLLSSD
ncbi:MAG: TRIC cation channel family protein [Chitinophagales bacterium]